MAEWVTPAELRSLSWSEIVAKAPSGIRSHDGFQAFARAVGVRSSIGPQPVAYERTSAYEGLIECFQNREGALERAPRG